MRLISLQQKLPLRIQKSGSMRKRENNSTPASVLRTTFSVAVILMSGVLLDSAVKAAPLVGKLTKPIASGRQGDKGLAISAPVAGPSRAPLDASFTFDYTGSLNTAREEHTGTLLPNGKILVVGGTNDSGSLSSTELYDPATGNWSATGSMNAARSQHTATLLPNGKVLVAGGLMIAVLLAARNCMTRPPGTGVQRAT